MMVPDGLRASSEQSSSLRQLLRETMTLKEKGPLDAGLGYGGEGGIRTPVPVTRQDAFEAPPLRPLRYLSVSGVCRIRLQPELNTQLYRTLRRASSHSSHPASAGWRNVSGSVVRCSRTTVTTSRARIRR